MRSCCLAAIGLLLLRAPMAGAQVRTDDLAQAGWRAIDAQDADTAEALFRQALTQRPGDAELHFGAGVAAHLQGRDEDAARFLRRSLAIEPRMTGASMLLGEIAYSEGDLDLAIKTYESALALSPRNGSALKARLETWRNEAAVHDRLSTVKDDRFSVRFDGPVEQKLAVRATTVLGNAFWTIGKTIGAYPNRPINVIFYSDQQF